MYKSIITIWLLMAANLYAQNNVFIMVDVSGSVRDNDVLSQTRDIIGDMLVGTLDLSAYPGWNAINIADPKIQNIINGQHQALLGNGSYVCIMPFGNKDRYKEYTSTIINQLPDDLNTFLSQSFPSAYVDNYTYIQIAQAYTAELAKQENLKEYFIFIVTDDLGDQENTSSQNTYDSQENDLLSEWNNPNFSEVSSLGSIGSNKLYIHFRSVLLKNTGGGPIEEPPCEVRLLSFPGGKSGDEVRVESEVINLNWNCLNCKTDQKYVVSIAGTNGNNASNIRKTTEKTAYSATLKSGKYRITISSPGCKPDSTYIQVKTGGGSGFLVLLLLLAAGAGGYFVWKNQQDKKIRKAEDQQLMTDKDEPVVIRKEKPDEPGYF